MNLSAHFRGNGALLTVPHRNNGWALPAASLKQLPVIAVEPKAQQLRSLERFHDGNLSKRSVVRSAVPEARVHVARREPFEYAAKAERLPSHLANSDTA